MSACPCDPTKTYEQCCAIYHQQLQQPETAKQLMRSRYSAFVMKDSSYLVETHDPKTRHPDLDASLQQTFQSTQWLGLEVIKCSAGLKKDKIGRVHFKAQYMNQAQLHHLEEHSKFRKAKNKWLYVGSVNE